LVLTAGLAGCAVNRVVEVEEPAQAHSIYKVPVIYGTTLLGQSSNTLVFGFSEYSPRRHAATSSCLGSADEFPIRFDARPGETAYHVLLVPPGSYVLENGSGRPAEAAPSGYVTFEAGHSYDLGVFRAEPTQSAYPYLERYQLQPVVYDLTAAAGRLAAFGINAARIEPAKLHPTDAFGMRLLVCFP
jgi:hypothetical protein